MFLKSLNIFSLHNIKKPMKKIIQILPSLDNSGGGVERGSLDVAKKLAEDGYDSYLMSSGGDMSEKYKHKGVKNIYLPLKKKIFFQY